MWWFEATPLGPHGGAFVKAPLDLHHYSRHNSQAEPTSPRGGEVNKSPHYCRGIGVASQRSRHSSRKRFPKSHLRCKGSRVYPGCNFVFSVAKHCEEGRWAWEGTLVPSHLEKRRGSTEPRRETDELGND